MNVNTNSWHYHVYKFTYWSDLPSRTNLCQYVRRIVFLAPLQAACALVLFIFIALIVLGALIFMPFFGYLPQEWNKPWNILCPEGTRKYQGFKLGNAFQVYPWHVLVAVCIIAGEVLLYHFFGVCSLMWTGIVLGSFVSVFAIVFGIAVYVDSDTGKIISEYLKAKKQKICPIVEFRNDANE